MKNIVRSHLADNQLFDFTNLQTGNVIDVCDIALDKPDIPKAPINHEQDETNQADVVTINLS